MTPVTLESSDATGEGSESFTPVDVRLVNGSGITQVVTLRARKKVWGQWKPILDKTGPGEGEILLNVDISDNPNLDFSQRWTGSMVIYVHSASNADFLRPINVNIDINELADEQTLGDLIDRDFSDDTDGKQFFFIPPQEGVSAPESIDGSDDGMVPSSGLGGYDTVAIEMLDAQGQPHKVNLRVSRTMYQSRSHITDARDKNNVHLKIEYSQEDNLPQTQGHLLTGQLLVIQQGYDDVTFQVPHLISLNIDTSNLGLDEWSRDFSADTPSGNSSVYFYTPVGQGSVIESGSDTKEDARWGAEGDYTRIVSQLTSIDGQTKNVVLRGYKNIGTSPLNEGMQRGYGKAVLRYVSEDNPTLVTDDYLFGDIQVVGQGWHDKGFHSLSKVKAQISTIADIQAFDSSKGSYYSPVYLQEEGALYYFVVPEQGSGVKGPKSSTVNASEGGRNEVTLWLEDENTGYEYPVSLSVQKQGCYLTKMNDTSTCEDNTSARLKVRFLPEKNEHLPEGEYSGKVVINRLDAND
ncbi:hypothetical protein, partial [Vibrio mediterranei]|uniref:hypothetical protein n=1 Tax=Vibrio mediterranei TaxID=689 RepID=UPI00148C3919